MKQPPKIEDAPGLRWRTIGQNWEGRWQARTDLINNGFVPKSQRVWIGKEPTELEVVEIQDECRRLQDEMLLFSRNGLPSSSTIHTYDGTYRSLINCYQTDPDSTYHKKR